MLTKIRNLFGYLAGLFHDRYCGCNWTGGTALPPRLMPGERILSDGYFMPMQKESNDE